MTSSPKLPPDSKLKFTSDIRVIKHIYTFFDKAGNAIELTIKNPFHVAESDNGTRIFSDDGISHYIPNGWMKKTIESSAKMSSSCLDKFVELDGEISRTYQVPNNQGGLVSVTIERVQYLKVTDNGHELIDMKGKLHIVPAGWIHLSWSVKDDSCNFSM